MAGKTKQHWTYEETTCLLALWSSAEVQTKIDGVWKTKAVFEKIQRVMASAGFERTIEQISNKLKKLRKDFRDQRKDIGLTGNGQTRRNPHFKVLASVLRPACQMTVTNTLETMVEDKTTKPQASSVTEMAAMSMHNVAEVMMPPRDCSSPAPSSSSSGSTCGSLRKARRGKRKRDNEEELLQYLERADEKFLQHSKEMNDALLDRMKSDTSALLGLMNRMVAVMEGQPKQGTTFPYPLPHKKRIYTPGNFGTFGNEK
ncbi:uncharacterized protein LOC117829328 [Notolabrus celidotus]|uniref:uncharacterized protein LOC117829328 n=1 Tax=Notolabrus celidotus TaxID=1203425 RepID=UPI00148F944D|nr:uncharacterized protein LOC117829328 [Notolabrus celidotus]